MRVLILAFVRRQGDVTSKIPQLHCFLHVNANLVREQALSGASVKEKITPRHSPARKTSRSNTTSAAMWTFGLVVQQAQRGLPILWERVVKTYLRYIRPLGKDTGVAVHHKALPPHLVNDSGRRTRLTSDLRSQSMKKTRFTRLRYNQSVTAGKGGRSVDA